MDDWYRAIQSREQLNDHDVGKILLKVEAGQRSEWQNIADGSPINKRYWDQWNFLAVRYGVLERFWELTDERNKITQTVLPQSKVKEILTELHGGHSGGRLGVNNTLDRQQDY